VRAQASEGGLAELGALVDVDAEDAGQILVDLGEIDAEGEGVIGLGQVENIFCQTAQTTENLLAAIIEA